MDPRDVARQEQAWLDGLQKAVAKGTDQALIRPRDLKRISGLGEGTGRKADELMGDLLARSAEAGLPSVACKKGCSFCCQIRVVANPVEIIRLAQYVQETFTPEERNALQSRLEDYVRDVDPRDNDDDFRYRCPMLVDRACSVHPARPIACRMHHSMDAQKCEAMYDRHERVGVPHVEQIFRVVLPIFRGLGDGVTRNGYRSGRISLHHGLWAALQEGAVDRWLGGKDIFRGMEMPIPPGRQP